MMSSASWSWKRTLIQRLAADRAGRFREHVIRLTTDQADGAHYRDQNDGQHNRVLCDVLAFILQLHFAHKLLNCSSIVGVRFRRSLRLKGGLAREGGSAARHKKHVECHLLNRASPSTSTI